MGLHTTGASVLLILIISPAEASESLGFSDPRLCYLLDFFLLVYGIVITALFVREKRCKPKDKVEKDSTYATLRGTQDTYAGLGGRDPEMGRARGQGRRHGDDDTYTRLKDKTEDTYKEIQVKKDRRPNEQVYQGLSSATKDTYDSLHMQPLPPRR